MPVSRGCQYLMWDTTGLFRDLIEPILDLPIPHNLCQHCFNQTSAVHRFIKVQYFSSCNVRSRVVRQLNDTNIDDVVLLSKTAYRPIPKTRWNCLYKGKYRCIVTVVHVVTVVWFWCLFPVIIITDIRIVVVVLLLLSNDGAISHGKGL